MKWGQTATWKSQPSLLVHLKLQISAVLRKWMNNTPALGTWQSPEGGHNSDRIWTRSTPAHEPWTEAFSSLYADQIKLILLSLYRLDFKTINFTLRFTYYYSCPRKNILQHAFRIACSRSCSSTPKVHTQSLCNPLEIKELNSHSLSVPYLPISTHSLSSKMFRIWNIFFWWSKKFKYTLLHEMSRFIRCKLNSNISSQATFD